MSDSALAGYSSQISPIDGSEEAEEDPAEIEREADKLLGTLPGTRLTGKGYLVPAQELQEVYTLLRSILLTAVDCGESWHSAIVEEEELSVEEIKRTTKFKSIDIDRSAFFSSDPIEPMETIKEE